MLVFGRHVIRLISVINFVLRLCFLIGILFWFDTPVLSLGPINSSLKTSCCLKETFYIDINIQALIPLDI